VLENENSMEIVTVKWFLEEFFTKHMEFSRILTELLEVVRLLPCPILNGPSLYFVIFEVSLVFHISLSILFLSNFPAVIGYFVHHINHL
jgi:hypothetical protein